MQGGVDRAAAFLRRRLGARPAVAVVLGSGLGGAAPPGAEIPFARIPGFPRSAVPGHAGALRYSRGVIYLRGRVHLYEGRPVEEVVRPVRILARLGVRILVLTNAAGGVNRAFRPGDLMLIEDHLNLTGANPLQGAPRFLDMSAAYDPGLRLLAGRAARRAGLKIRKGIYAAMAGPSYETPAEVRMLRTLGADAVGMSTVPETLAARAEGMRVLGFSCITNLAAGLSRDPLSHAEVLETMAAAQGRVSALLAEFLAALQGKPGAAPS